jgi:N-methylhydantoinase B
MGCYGVNGGKAGGSYRVSVIDAEGNETYHPGMCDTITVPAGSTIRIVTTGGGGWGDPLEREVEKVLEDVECALISEKSAYDDYGLVLVRAGRKWSTDVAATAARRQKLAKDRGKLPMFDRGSYYFEMNAAGKVSRPVGWTDPDAGWYAQPIT